MYLQVYCLRPLLLDELLDPELRPLDELLPAELPDERDGEELRPTELPDEREGDELRPIELPEEREGEELRPAELRLGDEDRLGE